jgi:hypothetical protein
VRCADAERGDETGGRGLGKLASGARRRGPPPAVIFMQMNATAPSGTSGGLAEAGPMVVGCMTIICPNLLRSMLRGWQAGGCVCVWGGGTCRAGMLPSRAAVGRGGGCMRLGPWSHAPGISPLPTAPATTQLHPPRRSSWLLLQQH